MLGALMLLSLLFAVPTPEPSPNDAAANLRARDQALLDAIAPGDVKLWEATLAPEAVYVDENGSIMNRSQFLAELKPLPVGSSGTIKIVSYSARFSGDLATVVHTDDEQEIFHGQHISAQYLTSETWQRRGGAWKLLMVHTYSTLAEPPSITLPATELDEYVGRYSAAPDLTYVITRDGNHLIGQRDGREGVMLKAEVRDVFFVSGALRTRKIFQRDGGNQIVGFVDRREGRDLIWKRL